MPAEELAEKVWRHEVASLMALTEAIDNSLTQQGLVGRSGEARTLVPYRLRANEKLRKTLHDLRTIQTEGLRSPAEDDRGDKPERNRPPNIPIALAETYERTSVEQIGPEEFDPETFLVTIIETNDPGTRTQDREHAVAFLARLRKNRPLTCRCFPGIPARDELQLRDWIEEMRDAGLEPKSDDRHVAALVRDVIAGTPLKPFYAWPATTLAVGEVCAEAVEKVRRAGAEIPHTPEDARALLLWKVVLSPDPNVRAGERLRAFSALQKLAALPRCTCERPTRKLEEWEARDAKVAHVIRMLVGTSYDSALLIASFPKAYLAVRDAVDEKLLEEFGQR